VIVTEALRRLVQTSEASTFTITVVAVLREDASSREPVGDPLKFESVSLITYEDPTAAGVLLA
jgi:hypothetical protein